MTVHTSHGCTLVALSVIPARVFHTGVATKKMARLSHFRTSVATTMVTRLSHFSIIVATKKVARLSYRMMIHTSQHAMAYPNKATTEQGDRQLEHIDKCKRFPFVTVLSLITHISFALKHLIFPTFEHHLFPTHRPLYFGLATHIYRAT